MSQDELARRVGVNRAQVVRWDAGRQGIRVSHLRVLAEALGCSVDDLLGTPTPR